MALEGLTAYQDEYSPNTSGNVGKAIHLDKSLDPGQSLCISPLALKSVNQSAPYSSLSNVLDTIAPLDHEIAQKATNHNIYGFKITQRFLMKKILRGLLLP